MQARLNNYDGFKRAGTDAINHLDYRFFNNANANFLSEKTKLIALLLPRDKLTSV